jgi:hypothetical protein
MVLGGPLLGALATVDVSRDETNTGAELSLYVTIVHRCSVSGEARLVYTSTYVYRFVAVRWVCYSGKLDG